MNLSFQAKNLISQIIKKFKESINLRSITYTIIHIFLYHFNIRCVLKLSFSRLTCLIPSFFENVNNNNNFLIRLKHKIIVCVWWSDLVKLNGLNSN